MQAPVIPLSSQVDATRSLLQPASERKACLLMISDSNSNPMPCWLIACGLLLGKFLDPGTVVGLAKQLDNANKRVKYSGHMKR